MVVRSRFEFSMSVPNLPNQMLYMFCAARGA